MQKVDNVCLKPDNFRNTLGPVPVDRLEEYVKPDWWKQVFNSLYLKTDGDVVTDINITESYCFTTISKPKINDLQIKPETPFVNQQVNISANIIDDIGIDEVKLSIEYPDSSNQNKTLYNHQWTTLTYDDFESGWGNYTDGGSDCWRRTTLHFVKMRGAGSGIPDDLKLFPPLL